MSIDNTLRQEMHTKIFYYALILTVVTLPFSLLANSISIIILFINWIAEGKFDKKIKYAKNNLLLLAFILFFILHLLGMLYTNNINNGLFELQKKLSLFLFPLVIATSPKLNALQIKNILKFFFFSSLLASFICLGYAMYRTNIFETYPNINWLYFSYRDLTMLINIQATYLALYISFSILILLFFFSENRLHYSTEKKIFFYLCMGYLIFFLFLLASRMAILSMLLISFTGLIYYFYKTKKLIKGLFILGILCAFIITLISQLPFMKERFNETLGIKQETVWINQYGDGKTVSPEIRKLKWQSAWNIIKENWLLGVGTGDTQDELQIQYKNINFEAGYKTRYNAHNQYLETWLGIGIAGLLLLLTSMILPFIFALQQKNYLFASFIALFFMCCITESMLCRQNGIVFYSLFISLFSFHSINEKKLIEKLI